MSGLDRARARTIVEGYINPTLHSLPETRAAVERSLDELEECIDGVVLTPAEEPIVSALARDHSKRSLWMYGAGEPELLRALADRIDHQRQDLTRN